MFEFYLLLIGICVAVSILFIILLIVKSNSNPVHSEEEEIPHGDLYVDKDILKDHKVFSDDDVFEDKTLSDALIKQSRSNK